MRRLPPVHSPLGPEAIAAAAIAALGRGEAERSALAEELRSRFDAQSVILTGSGTQALQLALEHLPDTGGVDRPVVALPGYSCYDLVTAAVGADVRVRFYDVDPVTLTPDLESLRATLGAGVSLVVAGNLYGYPLSWGPLRSECEAAGVPIVEDAAQGVGTTSDEGPGGTLGDATVLSFGRGKGWTGGGGGALLLRGAAVGRMEEGVQLASASGSARTVAFTKAAWILGRPSLYRIPTSIPGLGLGETHYKEPRPPERINAISAALTRRTAEASRTAIGERRRTARRLFDQIRGRPRERGLGHVCEPVGGLEAASFLRLPVVLDAAERAAAVVRKGIGLGVAPGYPVPLNRLPQSRPVVVDRDVRLAGSEELAAGTLTLPTHRWVGDEDVAALCRLLDEEGLR